MAFQHVFISGGSSGLGRGLSLHYARAGATVWAAARRKLELDALVAEAAGGPGRIVPVVLDVTNAEAQAEALRRADQDGPGLDLVIANAGVSAATSARALDWREVKRVLDVNVSAACVTLSAALPPMLSRGRGTVAAMCSMAAFRGLPASAAYCASKAALHTFMESLRIDLRGTGVRAVTIYPGFVKTEMTARNKHPMPFLLELDDAVRIMARGLDRGRPTIAYPFPMLASLKLAQLLPRPLWESLASRLPTKAPGRLPPRAS